MSGIETTPFEDGSSLLLIDLPVEVLLLVLQKCSAQELSALSRTCSHLRDLTATENIWKSLCKKDYSVNDVEINYMSYQELYTCLLHKHGWMLGLYHNQSEPYGGLLEVRYYNGVIQGNVCIANSHTSENSLTRITMFILEPGSQNPQCHFETSETHTAEISRQNNGIFSYKCPQNFALCHKINEYYPSFAKKHQITCDAIVYDPFLLQNLSFIPQNLKMKNGFPFSQIITPGLFTGMYGGHGIETIHFRFYEEYVIQGMKITGDPNVYSGKVSIKFDIRHSFQPTLCEQRSFEAFHAIEPGEVLSATAIQSLPCQKFVLPFDCDVGEEDNIDLPDKCLARYHGYGQIARHGFQDPDMIPVHVMIFSNDLIGVIWIDLKDFMLYHRIKEFV